MIFSRNGWVRFIRIIYSSFRALHIFGPVLCCRSCRLTSWLMMTVLLLPSSASLATPATSQSIPLESRKRANVVFINRAPVEEIARKLPGIGRITAERIVAFRRLNGPFRHLDELRLVKGVGRKTWEKCVPLISLD